MWRLQETKHQSKREREEEKRGFEGRERQRERKRRSLRRRPRRSAEAFREERGERGSLVWQRRGFCIVTI